MRSEKELYEQIVKKQMKSTARMFMLIFGILGAVFIVLGVVLLLLGVKDEDGFAPWLIFVPLGAFYVLMGCFLGIVIPRSNNYERYKRRVAKWGTPDYYQMYVEIQMQSEQIKELESRIEDAEIRIAELERRR